MYVIMVYDVGEERVGKVLKTGEVSYMDSEFCF